MDDQQESSRLEFDLTWKNAKCLNICEVEQLLKTPFLQGEASGQRKQHMELAFNHARRFSKLKDSQGLQELRMAIEDWEAPSSAGIDQAEARLAPFEQAQLVNLLPADAEEAISLIPSLERFSPIDISSLLEAIGSFIKGGSMASTLPSQYTSGTGAPISF